MRARHTHARLHGPHLSPARPSAVGAPAHRGVLPSPLELECGHLATEAVHEGDHLPRAVLARVPGAAEDLAIVLAHAARRVDREADVGRAAGAEALEEVAAPQPRLFRALRALGSTVGGARRCAPFRARNDGPAARHAHSPRLSAGRPPTERALSLLLTCPYLSRGMVRWASPGRPPVVLPSFADPPPKSSSQQR